MNRKPRQAWELYLKMETSSESFSLLQVIANDCYKVCNAYVHCYVVNITINVSVIQMFLFYLLLFTTWLDV